MKRLFTVLALMACCYVGDAQAQTGGVAGINTACVQEMGKQDQMGIDVPKYCSCLSTRLARHEGKLQHNDGERARKQVMNDLQPCFDEHMKTPVMTVCQGFNDKMAAEKQKVKMDCSCYYTKMIDNFSGTWAKNLANEPVTTDQQTLLAQEAVAACARQLP